MKWLGVVIPVLVAGMDSLTDWLMPLIQAHPKAAIWVGALMTVITALARSPLAKVEAPAGPSSKT